MDVAFSLFVHLKEHCALICSGIKGHIFSKQRLKKSIRAFSDQRLFIMLQISQIFFPGHVRGGLSAEDLHRRQVRGRRRPEIRQNRSIQSQSRLRGGHGN